MELKDKTVLITGGARVGQFVAEELLAAGAKLAMTYLKSPDEVHQQTKAYQVDISKETDVKGLLDQVSKDFGQVDGLINMASIFKPDPVKSPEGDHGASSETAFEFYQELFTINAFGSMLLSRLFAEAAKARDAKLAPIVSFIDWAIDHPYRHYSVYLASKAALRHYLMALQTQFAGTIRVVNIHPGMILEPLDFPAAEKEKIMNNTPTKNIGTPEQAAKLVRTALELDFLVDNIRLAGGQQWRHRL